MNGFAHLDATDNIVALVYICGGSLFRNWQLEVYDGNLFLIKKYYRIPTFKRLNISTFVDMLSLERQGFRDELTYF